jgi:hypothetical protein
MSDEFRLRPYEEMEHHPVADKLAQILCQKTQNTNPLFFRVLVGYYFSVMASMMRTTIITHDRGAIPVNLYAINLATSGAGKGLSTNMMEEQVVGQFQQRFTTETFPLLAENNLPKIAIRRASSEGTDPDEELERTKAEFKAQGALLFSFDNGTEAALKQARYKLQMADAGALNLQIDEIGSNLSSSGEALNAYLELYDVGKIKQKMTKNTKENVRAEDLQGNTPTNMMLFGTPSKLFDGGKIEEEFYSWVDTGLGRRCLFGYAKGHERNTSMTVDEVYDLLTNTDTDAYLENISDHFEALADMININKKLVMSERVAKLFIQYRLTCEQRATHFREHDEMRKAEMAHRYFKATKLAGAYAFVDDSPEITEENLEQAIKLVEESGIAFDNLLTRDKPYVKLAKYIAELQEDITHADLVSDLPFYPKTNSARTDMLNLAISHGYKNNIIIKKTYTGGIEFLRGETLKKTDLNEMCVSYSQDIAVGYTNEVAPFTKLHQLTQADGMHWVNHHLKGGHRQEDNAIAGFNLVVIDVDGGVPMATAQSLLKDYTSLIYTTKRHTADKNRFRIILPINYELKLDADDFKEFMHNIYEWLPFEVDTATSQRARKWMSNDGTYAYNDGQLLDALAFIPKTSKNEERKRVVDSQQSLDNLERWVVNNTGDGNRNNQLIRYAFILLDVQFDYDEIHKRVANLNNKLADKLTEAELLGTIMVTISKALAKRAA